MPDDGGFPPKPARDAPIGEGAAAATWSGAVPPEALPVASAPLAIPPYGAAAVPALDYTFDQVLFGFEAQLRAAAHVMRRFGRHLALAPLPEMFATPRSLAALRLAYVAAAQSDPDWSGPCGRTADAADAPIVHLRFGPTRYARVLKGARNVMVLAEDPLHLPVQTSLHPFGSDRDLPAPFTDVLAYGARRGKALVADRRALPDLRLSDAFLGADLDSEAHGTASAFAGSDRWPGWYSVPGLRVRSLAEVARGAGWRRDPAAVRSADAADWRRALALARFGPTDGDAARRRPPFIMLPWNLANPASIVPDIVRKLGRQAPFDAADHRLVLFPFNATPDDGLPVEDLAAELSQMAGERPGALRDLFVARLTSLQDARRLRRLFPLAWLEADDPESSWTAERLTRLNISLGLLGGDVGDLPHRFAIAPDEPIRMHLCDSFGERSYAKRSLSTRRLASLIVKSGNELAGRDAT